MNCCPLKTNNRRAIFSRLTVLGSLLLSALFVHDVRGECGSVKGVVQSYKSLTGSGSLIGFSGYRPTGNGQDDSDPEAPWNKGPIWKWRFREFSGQVIFQAHYDQPCECSNSFLRRRYVFSGHADAVSGESGLETGYDGFGQCVDMNVLDTISPIQDIGFSKYAPIVEGDFGWLNPENWVSLDKVTLTRVSSPGGAVCYPAPWYGVISGESYDGNATSQLTTPDTIEAAIGRSGSQTEGKFRRAFTQGLSVTVPKSTAPISFTAARSVSVTLAACDGTYSVIANLKVGAFGGYDIYGEATFQGGAYTVERDVTLKASVKAVDGKLTVEVPMRGNKVVEVDEASIRLISQESQPFGNTQTCTNSVDFIMHLGAVSGGNTAGVLRIKEESIMVDSFTTQALSAAIFSDSVEVIRDTNDNLRQILAPEGLADIVTLTATSYEVRLYPTAQVGGLNSTTGLHTVTGSPLVVYAIAEASGSTPSIPRLSITETRGSKSIVMVFQQNDGAWVTTSGNGLRTELLNITADGDNRVETREFLNPDTSLAQRTVTKIHPYSFGDKTIEEAMGSGTDVITTTYTWYDNLATDGMSVGELKSRQTSTGNWETWTYNSAGRQSKRVSQFLNSAFNSADSLNRVTEWTYGTLSDLDSDGADETLETEVEYLLGAEVSRRYRLKLTGTGGIGDATWREERAIVTTAAGAAWDAATNLVTVTRSGQTGVFLGRTLWQQNPDGTVMRLEFNLLTGGDHEWITSEGVLQLDDSILGRRTVVTEDSLGREISRNVYENTLLVESVTTLTRDDLGRPTLLSYLDGTEETRDYACCGLNELRSRDGVLTTYERDDLKRVVRETTGDVVTVYAYDAAGRQIQTSRVDASDNLVPMQTQVYATNGRLISSTDAMNRTTLYAETQLSGGLIQRTTTYADASEEIRLHYQDDSLASIRGDAAAWRDYAYGVDAGGAYDQEFFPRGDEVSSPAAQWVKRYRDQADRPSLVRYADAAEETYGYDAAGRLIRQTDPDGVQTLFAYNERGERIITALDLNRDGEINYGGTDRITRAITAYATRSGSPAATVLRTTTEVWEIENQNTPSTISVREASVTGLDQWSTTYGLTTHSVIAYNGTGGRTETNTLPDTSSIIRIYANGRLTSELRKDANNVTLSETAYVYDIYGRLSTQAVTGIGTTTHTYYADDQIASVTTPDPDLSRSGPGYDPQTTSYTYNTRGRQSAITHPDGAETQKTYYPTGLVKRTWGARTYPVEYAYDAQGRMKTLTTWQDFDGTSGSAVTTWSYDSQRGWLTGKRYDNNQGPNYTYTDAGRLATRTWARGVVTTYVYSNAGDLSGLTYSDSTPAVVQTYDRLGRSLTTTDAGGLLTRSYANGQLGDEVYTGSGLLSGKSVTRTFDSQQRRASLAAPGGYGVGYTYDNASRLATLTQGSREAGYSYHASLGVMASVTIKNSGTERARQEKDYDNLGRVTRVDTLGNGTTLHARRNYTYNAANQRTRVEHEDTRQWDYGYDALGQVTMAEKRLSDGTTALPGYSFGYGFDDIGNRVSTMTNGRPANYTSDTLNRYTARVYPGAVDVRGSASATASIIVNDGLAARVGADFYRAAPVANTSGPVDATIKIQAVNVGPPTQVATETRSAFVAQTPESFSYDADGNLTLDGRWSYTWDGENRLIAMETAGAVATALPGLKQRLEFAYDAQGRRVQKQVKAWATSTWAVATDTRFIHDGWNLLVEQDALNGNAVVRTHAWGLDLSGSMQGAGGVGGLLWTTTATATYAVGFDANGNAVAYINTATGVLDGRADYGAFGESVMRTGVANALPFGFSTKYADSETGLIYYGHRYLNVSTGRWLGRDPSEERGGLNLYGMIENDAVNWVDYLGLEALTNVPPEGTYILRLARGIQYNDEQAKRAMVPYDGSRGGYFGDGFEVEYKPAKTCPCAKEKIRLVQAIKSGWDDSEIDTPESNSAANASTPGGTPLPGYVQGGGRKGSHGSNSYYDAPYEPWSNFLGFKKGRRYQFEVCALCPNGTVLGCFTFEIYNNERIPRPTGSSPASAPGSLWNSAVERWDKASGLKSSTSIKYSL